LRRLTDDDPTHAVARAAAGDDGHDSVIIWEMTAESLRSPMGPPTKRTSVAAEPRDSPPGAFTAAGR